MAKLTLIREASDAEEEEDFYGPLPNQYPTNMSIDHKESFFSFTGLFFHAGSL